MKKVIVYGVGVNCDVFMRYAKGRDFEVVAFVDKFQAGYYYNNMLIRKPEDIQNIAYDELFLTVGDNVDSIKCFLTDKIGVEKDRIRDAYYLNKRYMLHEINKYPCIFINARTRQYETLYSDLKAEKNIFMSSLLINENKWGMDSNEKIDRKPKIIFMKFEYRLPYDCMQYFKDRFPNAKMVLIFSDMISGENGYERVFDDFSMTRLKELMDLIVTYHPLEAQKYNLMYYPQIFSKVMLLPEKEKFDVFFTGLAKNRLDIIHGVYKKLIREGITCKFWISGVEKKEQMLEEHQGITYNQKLSYEEYLNEVNVCKCILDVVQTGDVYSTRYTEAVAYNKKFLTNDLSVKKALFYDEKYVQAFLNVDDINCNWIGGNQEVDFKYDGEFSPLYFVKRICKRFSVAI